MPKQAVKSDRLLVADANGVRWFNVGDSPVYRVRDDGLLEQASVDDRFAPDLADAFGLVANALTACLGGYPEPVGFRRLIDAAENELDATAAIGRASCEDFTP